MEASSKLKSGKKDRSNSSRFVLYARGFKVPSEKQQLKAIGFESDKIPSPYNPLLGSEPFAPVPRPTSIDDWLAQYDEEGQTFREFLQECPWLSTRKFKYIKHKFISAGETLLEKYPDGKIYIVPVGNFDAESCIVFDDLIDYARRFLCVPVEALPGLKLEFTNDKIFHVEDPGVHSSGRKSRGRKAEIDMRYDSKSKHMQINVGSILAELRRKIPRDALCVIGLTMYDLYGDDTDLFVAGMAAGNQNVAVFSVLRYDPRLTFSKEFWYDIRKTKVVPNDEMKRLILQRSCKLVVHEIGHLLGIDHCIYFDCCMNGSGHLTEDFRQPMHLCPVDLHKLQVLTGFDVNERYQKLLEFYRKHGMKTEAYWVERRIRFIQDGETNIQKEEIKKNSEVVSLHINNLNKLEASGKTRSRKRRTRFIPYVKGLKLPSKQKKLEAVGFDMNRIPVEYTATPDTKFFPPIPKPTSIDDWLAQYKVSGQTFTDYVSRCGWICNTKHQNMNHRFVPGGKTLTEKYPEGKIYVIPIGDFDEEACFAFKDLLDFTRRYLSLPVDTLPNMKLESVNQELVLAGDDDISPVLQTRYNSESKHLQIHVSSLLSELRQNVPHDAFCLIGLTMFDLYAADTDLFVAGIASGRRNVAVFSIHRYNPRLTFSPEFWYDIRQTEDVSDEEKKQLMLQRSCKLVVHEIGHLLGIGHCIFYSCCMNGSGHLAEDFRQPMHLCPVDLHKLQVLTGFDVTERYQKLREFYKKHGMESEADWVERRIRFIQDEKTN